MLLSLISVLVLLVIAFFALWVGVIGRVSSSEGPELSVAGRALAFVIAIVAFGVAFAVYQHPVDQSAVVAQPRQPAVAAAMPSTPPESRGEPVIEPEDAISTELVMAPEPGAEQPEEPEQSEAPAAAAPAPAAAPDLVSEAGDDALSPSAAALENRASAPRAAALSALAPAAEQSPMEPAQSGTGAMTEVIGPAKRTRRYPLLLHVHNQLGPDQQQEQLTLRIEGKTVARIGVDANSPKAAVAIALPRPGRLHYRLEGFSLASGRTELLGHGCIEVRDGSRYTVRRAADGRSVFLEARRAAG